jgi:hypothetical protein
MRIGGGVEWINMAQEKESGRLFRKWCRSFEFHIMRGISWLNEEKFVSQEGVGSVVCYFIGYELVALIILWAKS